MMDADATEAESLTRLEAALDRIARQARPVAAVEPTDATHEIAARLDALIMQVRGTLAAEG